jgi:hypothetical protein
MPDQHALMTKLYLDPSNVDGTTYDKRWRRHESIQIVEAQATDNPEGQKILAVHGGGIEGGTSEIALGSVHEFLIKMKAETMQRAAKKVFASLS